LKTILAKEEESGIKITEKFSVIVVRYGSTMLQIVGMAKASKKKNLKKRQNFSQDDSYEELVVLMVTSSEEGFITENWFLNIGCSNHMTGQAKPIKSGL